MAILMIFFCFNMFLDGFSMSYKLLLALGKCGALGDRHNLLFMNVNYEPIRASVQLNVTHGDRCDMPHLTTRKGLFFDNEMKYFFDCFPF